VIDSRGAQFYLDNCNACHHSDGAGAQRTFPPPAKSEVVNAEDVTSLIHIVLTGSAMRSTKAAPSALAMPDFAWRLSDQDVADVLSFVRNSWGNRATPVAANYVGRLREATGVK
jgi:mono/diheme cytochrome c family protein